MPNVLILMSDEHNPRWSSPYGHPMVHTPNMEQLAGRGTVFENAYCPSPLCLPSRAAFMAGQRVHTLQAYSNCNVNLDPTHPSYGSVLRQQGVHTAYIGKTDVHAPGEQLGFSEMIDPRDRGLPGDTNHRRNPVTIRQGADKRANGYGPRQNAGSGDVRSVDTAVEWLTTVAPGLAQPWVLTVNVLNPHFPHVVTPELWEMYPEGGDLPTYGIECESARHPHAANLRAHFETEQFTEEQARGLRRGYLGCVTFVDRQLGRLMDALARSGQSEQTNVIYTSDHGDMLGKFGMWWKCSLYEDSVRVPCIAAGPGFAAEQRVTTPVDLHDVRASVFQSVAAEQPTHWLGVPLQNMAVDDIDRIVFAEYHGHGATGSAYMIRRGRWKYLHHCGAPNQLFDLAADPEELSNLHGTQPEIAAALRHELGAICSPDEENQRAEAFIEAQLAAIVSESDQ